MSEFETKSVVTGFVRSLTTAGAILTYIIGAGLTIVTKPIGVAIMIAATVLLGWSIKSSWADENAIKWLNITVKSLLLAAGILGLITILRF